MKPPWDQQNRAANDTAVDLEVELAMEAALLEKRHTS